MSRIIAARAGYTEVKRFNFKAYRLPACLLLFFLIRGVTVLR
jgi:hypothetical protein